MFWMSNHGIIHGFSTNRNKRTKNISTPQNQMFTGNGEKNKIGHKCRKSLKTIANRFIDSIKIII